MMKIWGLARTEDAVFFSSKERFNCYTLNFVDFDAIPCFVNNDFSLVVSKLLVFRFVWRNKSSLMLL
ncbi:hypothetical protein TNCT_500261 [Trichonephila clavata]|uniref:Uncharacterized protein n=1 Tax=Trichonephila clavata TaxID=2740835 RepID=A0A8X6FRA6_TRICU|nr:hypothetical protein TNCT_500261 [Trichonephila clavata]